MLNMSPDLALQQARNLIEQRYAEPISLDHLARAAGFSRFHFARLFRQRYGETPLGCLSRRRLWHAKELLTSTSEPVIQVCLAVGFQSPGSFSTWFQKRTGQSPLAYRRQMQARRRFVPACFAMRAACGDL